MKTLTIIPSRLSATRLPGKPLLKINNLSIISHVFRRAQEANIGDVVVAAEDQEIVDDVIKNGGTAILTGKNHKTGTDRIYEAFKKLELKGVDLIMNLQGDEPAINIEDIVNLNKKMVSNQSKMGTLAAKIKDLKDLDNENIVKVVTKENLNKDHFSKANNFLRRSLEVENVYHHIGIYAYTVKLVNQFCQLDRPEIEKAEKLEQMRAIFNDIPIKMIQYQGKEMIGVDTIEDFNKVKILLS